MNVQISEFVFSILGIEEKCNLWFLMYLFQGAKDNRGDEGDESRQGSVRNEKNCKTTVSLIEMGEFERERSVD